MFEDVNQMEKEIEVFRNNMLASSELIKGISGLTEATKKQKDSFARSSEELIQKLDSCVEKIKADHQQALQTLSSSNSSAITSLEQKMHSEQTDRLEELDQIKSDLINMQVSFEEKLHQTEQAIIKYRAELKQNADQAKAEYIAVTQTLNAHTDAAIGNLQRSNAADLQVKIDIIDGIKTSIEEYQAQNIKKANEQIDTLVEKCETLISGMKNELAAQESAYAAALQQAEQVIQSYQTELGVSVNLIKADHKTTLQTIVTRTDTAIENLQKNNAADLQAKIKEIDNIKTSIEEYQRQNAAKVDEQTRLFMKESEQLISEMMREISEQEAQYAEKLLQTERTIREYQKEAEQKYNDFLQSLKVTNVDRIFKEVQELKQSIQLKFIVLTGGIGITLLITLLSIFAQWKGYI